MSTRCASLPAELVPEWLDPRKPEAVPRREKVRWATKDKDGTPVVVEMTKELRIARFRRTQAKAIPPVKPPAPAAPPPEVPPGKPESPLLIAARDANLLGSRVGTDTFMVLCPWRVEHKSGRQHHGHHDQSTQINAAEGTFRCQHNPCVARTAQGFLDKLSADRPSSGKTKAILCIDDSGSISNRGNASKVREQVQIICSQLQRDSPSWTVVYVTFGERVCAELGRLAKDLEIHRIAGSYSPRQSQTKLYDLVEWAAQEAIKPDAEATLVYIITDGDENCSVSTAGSARMAVQRALSSNRVTFACVAPTSSTEFFNQCGIPRGCVRSWDGHDGLDLTKVTTEASRGFTDFTAARAAGKTKVENFFVDARKLDAAAGRLVDITSVCKVLKIEREAVLQPFVEESGLTFVVGANYYELTKLETLRPNRAILVRRKGDRKIFSGPDVRKVLGLPNDHECKVLPGDMGTYELFLESTSHNRMLVRGTDLIVRTDHQGSAHTWDKTRQS